MDNNQTPLAGQPELSAHSDPYRKMLAQYGVLLGFTLLLHSALRYALSWLMGLFAPLGEMIVRLFGPSLPAQEAVNQGIGLVLSVLLLLIPFAVYAGRVSRPAVHFRGRVPWRLLGYALPIGLLCNVLGLLGTDAIRTVIGWFRFTTLAAGGGYPATPVALGVYLAYSCIAAPVVEEIVFRGVLLGSLTRFGEGFAVAVSALVFSAVHGNVVQGPNTFLLGLVIGFFVVKTGSLKFGIVMHIVNNVLAHLLNLLLMYTPEGYGQLVLYGVLFIYALCGVIALIVLVTKRGDTLRFAGNLYDNAPYSKARVFAANAPMIVWIVFCALSLLNTMRFVGW